MTSNINKFVVKFTKHYYICKRLLLTQIEQSVQNVSILEVLKDKQ
jgi:hypothetical protein